MRLVRTASEQVRQELWVAVALRGLRVESCCDDSVELSAHLSPGAGDFSTCAAITCHGVFHLMSSIFLSSTGSGQSQGPEHYDLPATSWHGDPRGVAHWKPSGRTPRLWGMAGGVHYFSMSIMGLINQYVFGMG